MVPPFVTHLEVTREYLPQGLISLAKYQMFPDISLMAMVSALSVDVRVGGHPIEKNAVQVLVL